MFSSEGKKNSDYASLKKSQTFFALGIRIHDQFFF